MASIARGTQARDYVGVYDFKCDTDRVVVHYDKTYNINPGNQAGYSATKQWWHALNKSIHYNDVEFGNDEASTGIVAQGLNGLGNVFIWDLFTPALAATGTTIEFFPNTTYFWHER